MQARGSAERQLFLTRAAPLFEEAMAHGHLREDDPRLSPGGSDHAAFELLLSLGLLSYDPDAARYLPVDPEVVQSQVVTPLSQQGADLLVASSEWARSFGALAQTWRRSPRAEHEPFTELRGDAISPFISSLVADATTELLTAQPQTGRNAPSLSEAMARDLAALERGVRMRTLYQHSARRSAFTHKYVAAVTARGAEVRTLDEFFNRLIVIDDQVAIIPGRESLAVALIIRDRSLIAYLTDMFERSWERARPFTNTETSLMREIAAEQRSMTIRMLIEGHPDSASAKRLGVSPRTYAGYVADLKTEFDAETRFQLGYAMGEKGISGREAARAEPAPDDADTEWRGGFAAEQ